MYFQDLIRVSKFQNNVVTRRPDPSFIKPRKNDKIKPLSENVTEITSQIEKKLKINKKLRKC